MQYPYYVTGQCPVRDMKCTITVSYVPVISGYQKDIYRCEYSNRTGRGCGYDCPIYKAAPELIQHT